MDVRRHLIDALHAELVGPYDPQSRAEVLKSTPSRRYLTGFLAPPMVEARAPGDQVEAVDGDDPLGRGSDRQSEDGDTPDPEPATRKVFPASVGMSVLLPAEAEVVTARVRWGEYRRDVVRGESGELTPVVADRAVAGSLAWRRLQIDWIETQLRLSPETIAHGVPVANQVWLQGRLADAGRGDGSRALALFLVNRRPLDEGPARDESLLFQVEYELRCSAGFLARPDLSGHGSRDLDDQISDLQYRNAFEYAVGHGVAARAVPGTKLGASPDGDGVDPDGVDPEGADGERAGKPSSTWGPRVGAVEIAWIPEAEFKPVAARTDAPVNVSMQALGKLGTPGQVEAALGALPACYGQWIETDLGDPGGLSPERTQTLARLAARARTAQARIRAGIDLLKSDPQILEAFCYANRAMFFQAKQRGQRTDEPWAKNPKWRLFQLAFVLLSLDDIANPSGHDAGLSPSSSQAGQSRPAAPSYRDEVELIFFPTGGGKTEAYLGLIAFTLLLRRMRGQAHAHKGEGVAVLLRYTLRLLTLDQLERAATLICALEIMRNSSRYRDVLGGRRFEIGLWVGGKASANKISQFKDQHKAFRAGTGDHPCPIQICPWCNEKITAQSLSVEASSSGLERVLVRCHNDDCTFSKAPHSQAGLPVQFVDEQIYRELPCFVVATVDKFALLPWRGDTGLLFGRVTHRDEGAYYGPAQPSATIPKAATPIAGLLPPELIVQDELHLISGPLGTMVGLFETAVEALCTREQDGVAVRPKIIAATATVRRAQRQVQALYGRRETNIFPPQGLDPFETWFSKVDTEKPGRVYVGVAAAGRAMKRVLLSTYLVVLGAAMWAETLGGASPEQSDGYYTVVGYFNSLRELGGMRRLVEDDIATRTRKQAEGGPLDALGPHRWLANRRVDMPEELTSRVKTARIAEIKNRATKAHYQGKALDVLLASNMISVGIDISRLGVMVIAGQPKTTAEYIQASSRVGRKASWPGLVVTNYNIYRPRDRSHYEHFGAYHESFYRAVEATSVTPFSAPAIDRGLAAVVVAMARLLEVEMTASGEAMNGPGLQAVSARILEAVTRKAASQPAVGPQGEAAGDAFARTVSDRASGLLDSWLGMIRENKSNSVHMHYSPFDTHRDKGRPLLRGVLEVHRPDAETESMLTPDQQRFVAPTSMRDVEPSVHVWRRYKLGARD